MASVEELKAKIADLEGQLASALQTNSTPARSKITQMSSEVVDSNPYRYVVCVVRKCIK
jgi:hypothetical protein